jgi:alanine racemase
MARPLTAYLDFAALTHNYQQIKKYAPHAKVMAVVKANAYGHGIERIARHLTEADAFAVASIDEALMLRYAGIEQPIVLLEGTFSADELPLVAEYRLSMVVHCQRQLDELALTPLFSPVQVWLKIDTGMHRLGFDPSELLSVWRQLDSINWVQKPVGLMSHFASADDVDSPITKRQQQRFMDALSMLPAGTPSSMANSAAIVCLPESHWDWVRPGLMLYGVSPCPHVRLALDLRPVMTLVSEIIAIKTVQAGESVGYGGSWLAKKITLIAIVAVGYGDGYPRHIQSNTQVLIRQKRAVVVGRVSMDMIAVNVSEIESVCVGDKVVLWGEGLCVSELAQQAHTIAYELLCGVTKRVPCVEISCQSGDLLQKNTGNL